MTPIHILLLDTETNGLPPSRFAPPTQWEHYPAILQLSWAIYTVEAGQLRECQSYRDIGLALHPSIPWNKEAAAIHGITEIEARRGTSAVEALTDLQCALHSVDYVIAHNLSFDKSVIRAAAYAEAARGAPAIIRKIWPTEIKEICTMKASQNLVQLESPYYGAGSGKFKPPKLNELYTWLYGQPYDVSGTSLHSARTDTDCLTMCMRSLLRHRHIVL